MSQSRSPIEPRRLIVAIHDVAPPFYSPVRDLRDALEQGDQLVLHGWQHRTQGPLRGSPVDVMRAKAFAPGAAEFLTLDALQAAAAVSYGLELLDAAGLPAPDAFCAPGWLISRQARAGVAAAGISLCIGMFDVLDLRSERWQRLVGFGNVGAGPRQEAGVRLLNDLVAG